MDWQWLQVFNCVGLWLCLRTPRGSLHCQELSARSPCNCLSSCHHRIGWETLPSLTLVQIKTCSVYIPFSSFQCALVNPDLYPKIEGENLFILAFRFLQCYHRHTHVLPHTLTETNIQSSSPHTYRNKHTHVYPHTYLEINVHTCIPTHTETSLRMCFPAYIWKQTYTYVYPHTYRNRHTHVLPHTYRRKHTKCFHTHIKKYTNACASLHTYRSKHTCVLSPTYIETNLHTYTKNIK